MIRFIDRLKKYFGIKQQRDYHKIWLSEEGRDYREVVYNRQKTDGIKPLGTNPTIDEIKSEISKYDPKSVLEVGCGWGRLLEPLSKYFNIEGCDICNDYLNKISPNIRTFYWDIVKDTNPFPEEKWDVIFVRGVFLYFNNDNNEIESAMNNLINATNKALIIWEWPEVINIIRSTCHSSLLVVQPIMHLDE